MFSWWKNRIPIPKEDFQVALHRQALRMGVPDERYDELIAQARDQIITETGGGTWYDVLRRAAAIAKNS